jgi:hypothetical protein
MYNFHFVGSLFSGFVFSLRCSLQKYKVGISWCVWEKERDGTQWYDDWWQIRWVFYIQILGKLISFVVFTPIQYETTIWNIFLIWRRGMFNCTCCLRMCTGTFYHKQDVCMCVCVCMYVCACEWINEFYIIVRYSACKKNSFIVCVFVFLITFVMLDGCRARIHWVEM